MRYTLEIKWSDENDCYVVIAPEWEGRYLMPITDGKTYEEAARHGKEVLEQMIDLAQREGTPLPQPKTYA